MDSEGGGGDGGGGEDRDADLSPQALSLPLLTLEVSPEQGSSSHTSATAPAKEPLTLPQQQEEEGAEGSQAREETQGGVQEEEGGRHLQENGACQKQGMKEDFGEGYLSGRREEEAGVHGGVGEASVTGGLPAALCSSSSGEKEKEEEEAISNQSQTKSKCSLLPQQSQHSSSSSTAKASGTLDNKTAASPKPSPTPSASPKPSPFLSTSPKHFTCPSSSPTLQSETEVKDIKGDQGWISEFPQSFKSQPSTLAGIEPASTPAEDVGPAGGPHSSISSVDGAKAPEPNDSQLDTEVDDEREQEEEQKEAVLKNLNPELSPNSLTSHMTIMHSRNSCKTLKCPKCNWHYKSQHTLQVHMKEKHPETGGQCVCGSSGGKCICGGATRDVCGYCSSGKAHPRLARGETYACGYKPYRCEVCDYATSSKGNLSIHMQSDKHLNNVQNGGHSNGHLPTSHVANNSSSSNGPTAEEPAYKLPLCIPSPTAQPAKLTPPAHSHSHGKRWRCDVCDYETSIARNLRIHTTSEKHTHNMLRLQRGYYLSHCRSLAPQLKNLQNTGAELSLNMRLTSQQLAEQPVTLGSALTPSPSPSPSPPPAPSLSPTGPLSQGVFQCLVCSCFSSDSLESVEQHLNATRSLPQSMWCSLVAGGCHCRLCGYTTPLRANFSLHCQTDRHRIRYQLAAHLQEGGDRGQEGEALIAKGNPVQLRCNLCDCVTSSLEKLRGHSLGSHHKASVRVYRFLQQYDGEVDGGSWLFHCLLCNHSSSSKLQVLKHSQTATHQQREGLLQLQPMGGEELAAIFTIRKIPDGDQGEFGEDIETSSETTTGPLDTTKDKCILISEETVKVENKEEEREQRGSFPSVKRSSSGHEELEIPISTKRPRLHQQNENQQERNTVQCPLCQVNLPYKQLQQHLTHVHSVAEDCVDKLISTVTPSFEQPPLLQTEPEPELCSDESLTNASPKINNAIWSNTTNTTDPVDSQKDKGISVENGTLVENAEEEVATPKDVTALLTPPLEDNTTHHSNGRLAPQSPTQFPPSSPPSSPASDPPPLSDRHGYRFRCSRCSLAFPTQEKLQLHWQYHAMRAATECPICSRQCRSQEALHRHMQNTHSQLDNTQGQNTLPTPHTTQFMEINKSSFQQNLSLSPQVGQEAGEAEDEDMEEEEAIDMNRKEETKEGVEFEEKDMIDETDGSEEELTELEKGLHGEIRSEPSSSSPVKRGSNPTMDRYLDPTRPYKCTICSESFTQKTILLVHYNSVSHLHRARRALQDPGTCVTAPEAPRGPDPRPYRCRLCGVGYSQSSTLDIHLRSVLHQTRARAAQNSAPQTPASSVAAPVSVSNTATQAATTREDKTSKCFTKRPNVVSSSTSSLFQGVPAEAQSTLPNPSDNQQVKKRVAELLASRNQLMLIQQQQLAQAQAQAQLQQQTALLQSHLLQHLPLGPENLLKQHFSLTAENLLNLQQQLLLPFYLSGDMKLNSEISVKNPELSQLVSDFSIANYQIETEAKGEFQPKRNEKQIQRQHLNPVFSQHKDPVHREAIVEAGYSRSSVNETERQPGNSSVEEGKQEMPVPTVKNEGQKRETDPSPCNVLGLQCPPPRIPYASVNGEPLRALLQSYGFELALQYIQSRHRNQQQISTHVIPDKQEYCDNKEIGVLSEEKREKVFELQDVRLEGCNTDKDGEEVNGGIEDLPQDEAKKKEESGKKCCGRGKECRDCGKFFSDSLILKSHQEYIHRSLFPTAALERFSREYRLQYDQMYPLPQPKSGEDLTTCPQAAVQAPSSESETAIETVRPQVKTLEPLPSTSVSELVTKTCSPASDPSSTAPPPSSPVHSQPQDFSQEAVNPSTSATVTSHTTSQATSIPLPLPMLPLSLPQLSMPPLTLPKLSLPPGPFPMELPLLSPLVMQSVALQSKPWLDSNVNPELAKLYQSQLNQALLGQQPQLNPSLLAQQPQLSPVLQIQPPQLNPVLLGQKSQPNPTQTGQQQQPQASPTTLEGGKRTRTRISEEQLTVLRKHFDINSLPSDQEINKMSALAGLPLKVIKHWFRNTLFKERQRDKDSPYNFNNPPTIALEESRKEMAQSQPLSLSPCSLSPGLPVNISPEPLTTDIQREELHRGRRSSRTRFTEQQLETLQRVFEATPYPREEEYDRLSARLSLSNRVIVVWFQNARQRARKHQDQGNDDGSEGKNQHDNIHRQRNGRHKNEDYDNDDNSCGDERHSESQNENSMDLTYEYYTHPDSPFVDSTSSCPESEHPTAKGASTPVTGNQEDKIVPHLENTNTDFVQTQNGISDADIKHKDIVPAIKTESSPKPEPTLQPERTAESPAPCSTSSSQKNELTILSTAHSSQGRIHSPLSDQAADTSSLPAPPEQEKSHKLPDSNSGLPTEVQPNIQPPPQTQAQFQCSLCPMSLPSFQLWQEHQTRHLLAAQSQVQFLHSGFPERSMPYMMLHPNHTLMASQMLSGAMSQMHPNPTHPMMSHLNNIQIKNTLSEHSSTSLTSLSQTSLATIKQNSKIISEGSFEGQRSSREIDEEQRRDKRQRTTITPEQLEVLYQRYSMDSNPTRGVLESIARDVGLTRRVVQVWFQNTRARERKGQFRSLGPGSNFSLGFNHLRCPFCRALFKVKSALDAHMRSRHWTEAERAGYNLSMSNGSNGQIGMAMSSVMDRPGPSVSFYPNHGIAISNNQLTVKPSMTSLSTTDLKNQEEEDDYEEDEEEYPCEEGSSLADQGSPSPEGSGGPGAEWGETQALQQQNHQQQRQRTQMSHYQVMQLRDFYRSHRNPNRHECEALGQELGLPHRVVQVWFQNARAKEKRARSLSSDAAEREQAELSAGAGERDRA